MSGSELARRRSGRHRTRYAAIAAVSLGVVGGLALFLGPDSPARTFARLEVLTRAVELRQSTEAGFGAVSATTDIAAGSVVRTLKTGLAEIAYGDGSLTRVGPDTTYTLTTLRIGPGARQIVGRLETGQTFHRVTKVTGSRSRFEVQTSKALATVRGTAFSVQCLTTAACEVAVTEGTVSVMTPDGRSVDVTAGHRVVVGADGELGALEDISRSDPWIAMNIGRELEKSTTVPTETQTPSSTVTESADTGASNDSNAANASNDSQGFNQTRVTNGRRIPTTQLRPGTAGVAPSTSSVSTPDSLSPTTAVQSPTTAVQSPTSTAPPPGTTTPPGRTTTTSVRVPDPPDNTTSTTMVPVHTS